MDTNGNRHRQHDDGLGPLRESSYTPRRRRNDAITTGLIGFVVGGVAGLSVFAAVSFLAWLGTSIEDRVGIAGLLAAVILTGGITLAVSGYRSVDE